MNYLQEKGLILEKVCGSNFAYVLCESGLFLPTEYKVLQSREEGSFVKCMKMLYNGDVELYYLTGGYKSLASMLPKLDPEGFLTIVTNLLSDVLDVKHNGFLSCENVDITFEKIFVEPSTYKVFLVYLPINEKFHSDYGTFENELRSSLVKLIVDMSTLHSPKVMQLATDLSNGMLTLDNIVNNLKLSKGSSNGDYSGVRGGTQKGGYSSGGGLKLVAMNMAMGFELAINRPEFIIGKKETEVNGCIPYNKMISRVHCKIQKIGSGYVITDLQSANGTYVNKVRLQPNQPYPLKIGDSLRLANSDFKVESM